MADLCEIYRIQVAPIEEAPQQFQDIPDAILLSLRRGQNVILQFAVHKRSYFLWRAMEPIIWHFGAPDLVLGPYGLANWYVNYERDHNPWSAHGKGGMFHLFDHQPLSVDTPPRSM